MNKQSLYVFGGALMATTALATTGHAATIRDYLANGSIPGTTSVTTRNLAVEVFSATTTVANAQTIGSGAMATQNGILIDWDSHFTSTFNVQLNVTNAAFTGTPIVTVLSQGSVGGTLQLSSTTGCSIQSLPDKLLITGCSAVGSATTSRADAMTITGIQFISAAALATAGQTVKLDGVITNGTGSTTFESITQVTFITSKSAAEASVQAATALVIDNTATPVFAKFVTPASATATLGTIHFSVTGAVGTDLSNTFASAASITGAAEVKVTHSALTDPALKSISILGLITPLVATSGQFVSGTVSFQVPGNSLANTFISVTFDGTTGITASSGTASATVTPTTGPNGIVATKAAFTGNLAAFTRGGLSVELNSMFPTAGAGSTLYRSVLRIANTSSIDGTATLTVKNDMTGAAIGSYTTLITSGSTKQISSADIEAAITTAAATGATYKVTVSGSFNGYVQHLLWNSVTGIFTDLSGFRNGALTVDP